MAPAASEVRELRDAKYTLEHPGIAATLSNVIGMPLEGVLTRVSTKFNLKVGELSRKAVETALDVALRTMDHSHRAPSWNRAHTLAVTATGAVGGTFGLVALAVELPISTAIMLRSIADIARSEGEDLSTPDARLQCVHVLGLGGRSGRDDGTDTGYLAVRAAIANSVTEAATHLAHKGLASKGAPAIVRFIAQVSTRFSIVVSQKAAAQTVPLIGAIGGGAINTIFLNHFQDMAKAHFIVRRLERAHGFDEIGRLYAELRTGRSASRRRPSEG
ncbi:MAG: EcsC family protein [Chromatiales bacterium]|nr:EcsC family protein [Chromatiales bacterium]